MGYCASIWWSASFQKRICLCKTKEALGRNRQERELASGTSVWGYTRRLSENKKMTNPISVSKNIARWLIGKSKTHTSCTSYPLYLIPYLLILHSHLVPRSSYFVPSISSTTPQPQLGLDFVFRVSVSCACHRCHWIISRSSFHAFVRAMRCPFFQVPV